MRSIRFDREVTIERPIVTKGATTRAPIVEYVPLVAIPGSPLVGERFPANLRDVAPSRSEAVRNGLQQARNQTVLTLRWRADITAAMRVRIHGDGADTFMQIVGGPAEVGGRKHYIEFMLERYSTAGNATAGPG